MEIASCLENPADHAPRPPNIRRKATIAEEDKSRAVPGVIFRLIVYSFCQSKLGRAAWAAGRLFFSSRCFVPGFGFGFRLGAASLSFGLFLEIVFGPPFHSLAAALPDYG